MKKTILLLSGIMVMSCTPQQKKLTYPKAEKVDTVDVYFGTEVADLIVGWKMIRVQLRPPG